MKEILRRLRVALIATKWTTPTPESGEVNGGGNNWNYRDYVPNCWQVQTLNEFPDLREMLRSFKQEAPPYPF